jgi:hypothetical protein
LPSDLISLRLTGLTVSLLFVSSRVSALATAPPAPNMVCIVYLFLLTKGSGALVAKTLTKDKELRDG